MNISRPMIDIFCHIYPPEYRKALHNKVQYSKYLAQLEGTSNVFPARSDLELRLKILGQHEGMRQVLTSTYPTADIISPDNAVELARIVNDEMAELVAKYPDKFVAGVACLPLRDIDAALREAERAIKTLKFKGIEIYTPCNSRPLDSPAFFPLYEMMTKYDLPVWLHPSRLSTVADYEGEEASKYNVFQSIGWPYETTVAMIRLVFGGVLEKYPSLKIITHHLGGMAPYYITRLALSRRRPDEGIASEIKLSRPPIEYFKMFYADTVVGDNISALMCGYSLFGAGHMLFATDLPSSLDYEQKIAPVEKMPVSESEKKLIFEGNARRLLHL